MSNNKNLNFIIISAAILGLMCIFILILNAIGSSGNTLTEDQVAALSSQTQPVGSMRYQAGNEQTVTTAVTAGSQPAEEPEPISGKQVYDTSCTSCHSTGLPNVPQFGSISDWETRISQGELLLYDRAINGFTGASGMVMPAKGGNPSLSDDEIRAAVDYIIENSQ